MSAASGWTDMASLPLPDAAPRAGRRIEGRLVYAIGDVHGCYDLLTALLERIARDAREHAGLGAPMLIFAGDYIDRGARSADVLSALVWLRGRRDLAVCTLKGNHEDMLLAFIDDPVGGADWLRFGGAETLRSYGVAPPAEDGDAAALITARDALLNRMPADHLRLLQTLPTSLVLGDYAFVHAGVRPGVPLDQQSEDDLLWIGAPFLEAKGGFGKTVVHGHSWISAKPYLGEDRIGVDTGAYETGVLTAVRITDAGVGVLQVGR